MRTLPLVLSALLAAGAAFPAFAGSMSHEVSGTVVAVDAAKNTLTIKGADGKDGTAPVEGEAQKMLGTLKPGDKIVVTCRDDEKGAHVAVSAIKKADK